MIWAGRRDHLVVYMTSISGRPSSSVGEERGSFEWSSIPRPTGSLMLRKIEEKKKNMSVHRNLR